MKEEIGMVAVFVEALRTMVYEAETRWRALEEMTSDRDAWKMRALAASACLGSAQLEVRIAAEERDSWERRALAAEAKIGFETSLASAVPHGPSGRR